MASSLTGTAEFKALHDHYEQMKDQHMRALFDGDQERFKKFRWAPPYICEICSVCTCVCVCVCVCMCVNVHSVTLAGAEGEVLLDYSKNIVTENTMKLLFDLVCVHGTL